MQGSVRNTDNECFKWAILSALYLASQNFHRVSNYKQYKDKLHFRGIDFPVTLKSISEFEKLNDISVNVYGLNRRKFNYIVCPLYLASEKREQHVNLLHIQDHYIDERLDGYYIDDNDQNIYNLHFV